MDLPALEAQKASIVKRKSALYSEQQLINQENNGSQSAVPMTEEEQVLLTKLHKIDTELRELWSQERSINHDIELGHLTQKYSFWSHFGVSHWGMPLLVMVPIYRLYSFSQS